MSFLLYLDNNTVEAHLEVNDGIVPTVRIEIDFDTDPTAAMRVWTDVTADVRHIAFVLAGRNDELQRTEPGSLNALLNNRHGDYDSTNTAGAYYPGVKRMRWIRVRANWAGVEYDRWKGLIESWQQSWPAYGNDATVQIQAVDGLKVLNMFDLDGLSYPSQTTGQRVAAVLADVGITDYIADSGSTTLPAVGPFAEGTSALSHLLDVEATENGLLFADGAGRIVFQARSYRKLNSATSSGTIGDQAGEIGYRSGDLTLDDNDIWNTAVVTPAGGTPETATDTVSVAAHFERQLSRSSLSTSQAEALGSAQYLVARYGDSAERIPAVELLGANDTSAWPLILGAQNSDRYTWTRRATAHTITVDGFVERVADEIVPGSEYRVTVQLSPATDLDLGGWVLDVSTLGVDNDLSYY